MPTRRRLMLTTGLLALGGWAYLRSSFAANTVIDISMGGTTGGAQVWFDPKGLLIQPGQTLRWTNRDAGNSHTATSYHPKLYGKSQRIPKGAQPWDSGFLLPGESFSVTLTMPGVYDYYCLPHELAGMVGRIIVAKPSASDWQSSPTANEGLSDNALKSFPSLEEIMREKVVHAQGV